MLTRHPIRLLDRIPPDASPGADRAALVLMHIGRLARAAGDKPLAVDLGGCVVEVRRLDIVPGEVAALPPHLTPMEQHILAVLAVAERPLKQSSIARRMGQPVTSHFKGRCGRLRRDGLLLYLHRRGYWRPDRKVPPEPDAD